jgi:hypothetical protein
LSGDLVAVALVPSASLTCAALINVQASGTVAATTRCSAVLVVVAPVLAVAFGVLELPHAASANASNANSSSRRIAAG